MNTSTSEVLSPLSTAISRMSTTALFIERIPLFRDAIIEITRLGVILEASEALRKKSILKIQDARMKIEAYRNAETPLQPLASGANPDEIEVMNNLIYLQSRTEADIKLLERSMDELEAVIWQIEGKPYTS